MKLSATEVQGLASAPDTARMASFERALSERISRYRARGERGVYEFVASALVDPWSGVAPPGFEALPKAARWDQVGGRELEFQSERVSLHPSVTARKVRQVMHWQGFQISPLEVRFRARDLYTDHYFDGWGEFVRLSCRDGGELRLEQQVWLEIDLLKKQDLLTRLSSGELRRAIRSQVVEFMTRRSAKIFAMAWH